MSLNYNDQIVLKGVRLRAPAGTGETCRTVEVRLSLDLRQAAFNNRIDRTVDYREVHEVLKRTALRDGILVENLTRAVLEGFPQVMGVEVASSGGSSHSRSRGKAHGTRC